MRRLREPRNRHWNSHYKEYLITDADKRAYDLLMRHLNRSQRGTLHDSDHFFVTGKISNHTYRITSLHSWNINVYNRDHVEVARLCATVKENQPQYDVMLTCKMFLEYNEREFVYASNTNFYEVPGVWEYREAIWPGIRKSYECYNETMRRWDEESGRERGHRLAPFQWRVPEGHAIPVRERQVAIDTTGVMIDEAQFFDSITPEEWRDTMERIHRNVTERQERLIRDCLAG